MNVVTIDPCSQWLQSSLISLLETICGLTHFLCLDDKAIALKRVRLIATHEIAPPLLLFLSLGRDVKESFSAICHGQHVEILPDSAHQGLCNHDFPEFCTKLHDDDNNNDDPLTMVDFICSLGTEQHC